MTGHLARLVLEDLRADRVILELRGGSAAEGLTDDHLLQAELARILLRRRLQVVVLIPPERVGRVAAVYIGPVTGADIIVTAREADSAPPLGPDRMRCPGPACIICNLLQEGKWPV